MRDMEHEKSVGFFRMFDVPATPFKRGALLELAGEHVRKVVTGGGSIPAGYTYLGQLIAHDIARSALSPGCRIVPEAATSCVRQERTPSLDLDSMYGDGMTDPTSGLSPLTGKFEGAADQAGRLYDLPRTQPDLRARIVDDRNDDNFIVAQLLLLFMRLHNRLVDERMDIPCVHTRFERARAEVTFLFQRVIWNDYLPRILQPEVYGVLSEGKVPPLLEPVAAFEPRVPIEFSAAAFRFGHPLVRISYTLNEAHKQVDTGRIFRLTGCGRFAGESSLEPFAIDWRNFFPRLDGDKSQAAMEFSTYVSPVVAEGSRRPPHFLDLAQLDLVRGSQFGLPDAQSIIAYLARTRQDYVSATGLRAISNDELEKAAAGKAHPLLPVLRKWGFDRRTPLWTYILLEPSVLTKDAHQRLGTLGSIIVGEVIHWLLRTSHLALCFDDDVARDSVVLRRLNGRGAALGMAHLINFVEDAEKRGTRE
jgi:hypothetical protein